MRGSSPEAEMALPAKPSGPLGQLGQATRRAAVADLLVELPSQLPASQPAAAADFAWPASQQVQPAHSAPAVAAVPCARSPLHVALMRRPVLAPSQPASPLVWQSWQRWCHHHQHACSRSQKSQQCPQRRQQPSQWVGLRWTTWQAAARMRGHRSRQPNAAGAARHQRQQRPTLALQRSQRARRQLQSAA